MHPVSPIPSNLPSSAHVSYQALTRTVLVPLQDVLVIGVEPTGANSMAISLARGERIKLQTIDVFADGVAIKAPGAECFRICRSLLDGTRASLPSAVPTTCEGPAELRKRQRHTK